MSFDEQPDGDPHGECAAEIHRLEARIAQLEAERDTADQERIAAGKRIAELEAQLAAQPVGDMSPDQNWKGLSGSVAYHLIDRHCETWEEIDDAMNKWREANTSPAAARGEPVAWQFFGVEGTWIDCHQKLYDTLVSKGARPVRELFTRPVPAVPAGWISVEDRLPDNFITKYLVFIRKNSGGTYITTSSLCLDLTGFFVEYDEDGIAPIDEVTHWMPLPPAPKEPT